VRKSFSKGNCKSFRVYCIRCFGVAMGIGYSKEFDDCTKTYFGLVDGEIGGHERVAFIARIGRVAFQCHKTDKPGFKIYAKKA
jgi:hypothetical protein